ncbi:MAG: hypothetical protein GQ564_16905 [Bacteroidales bacterium]|nr:hypothetical protein [Bacteroidales bacterium]
MDLDDYIEEANKFYNEGLKAKDIARKSDNNLQLFQQAADCYGQAANILKYKVLLDPTISHDQKIQGSALEHYYRFEENDCLYFGNYKNLDFPLAIQCANTAQYEIEQVLSIVDSNRDSVGIKAQDFLLKMEINWKSSSISIKIKKLEPVAKQAMINEDFLTALDTFNQMLKIQKKMYEYVESANLEQVHIRIAKGNYIGMSANVNQAMAGVLTSKIDNQTFDFDLTNDLLSHFLNSVDFSLNAFDANPEWDKYRSGAEIIKSNIQTLLEKNKENWFNYLTSNNNNQLLITIMQQTDNDLYKKQKAKLELENDNLKRIIISGGFWFGIFIGIGYFLLQLASSDISWYRFLSVIFFLPLFFIIVGAFALKTTNSLKEENFIKLMELTLTMSFKGLKALSEKDETE